MDVAEIEEKCLCIKMNASTNDVGNEVLAIMEQEKRASITCAALT